jgi:UDP-N-acetylglucosamine acyltransferase
MIHPTAIVSPAARIGAGVTIGPHALVEGETELGDNAVLHGACVIAAGTILGAGVVVHPFATIGGPPQYLKFDAATRSGVRVGAGTVIREAVTINRSIKSGEFTTIGEQCFLMANSHVAHDCALADRVILANGALLAGHVTVGADVFFGGGCALHQFTRVGEGAIIGGLAAITFDIPPYVMVADRNRLAGFNFVGLRRRGVPRATIAELKELFSRVYAASNPKHEAAAALAAGAAATAEGRRFLEFFGAGKRGIVRPGRGEESQAETDHAGENA